MISTRSTRGRAWTRILRVTAVIVVTLALLTAVSAIANAAITGTEKSTITPYGQKVTISAGDINVYRNGGSGPTMVLLSGFGTPAPAIDFAPLVRELDDFNVLIVEGFGYGYSDTDIGDRTIENITSELHEVLHHPHVDSPMILVGHSIGGLYARYYSDAYPGEVAAYIGIDPMVAMESTLEVGTPSTTEGVQNSLGLFRLVSSIAPDLIQPPGTAYTAEERRRTAAMTNWNYGNPSISDEWGHVGANSTKAAAKPFSTDLPVLEILSSESIASIPGWLPNHTAELTEVTTSQLEVLDGSHYLHWTQSPALARIMTDFIAAHVTS
ncbi:MAG: alpha/beta fold hydrolase [Rhodoglobus sp.]